MGWLDGIRNLLTIPGEQPLQARSEDDPSTLAELLARTQPVRLSPWRTATTREAMGVPAVFKAISLISNTIGSLSMEAYRNGAKLAIGSTPQLVIRPNPFTRPHMFWRDSSFHLARRGEAWWWIAKRDPFDDSPMSLIPIDPRQVTVTENPKNLLRPIIEWRGVRMPNEDMVQVTYLLDPNNPLRGYGPLQACGAAVSVAVEAQEWAANFFAGNPSNTWIKSAVEIDEAEAAKLKAQWVADATNLPKVTGPVVEDVKDIGTDPDKAQMSEVRLFQNGEVALMFSMPPTLLNYAVQGSTITYQNVGQIADDFTRQCLLPHYLEPMEQAMSDLLTRSTVGRFNLKGLLRADIKTRFDVHEIAIRTGIYDSAIAAEEEGYEPGDVENRPVPEAPPSAVPTVLPIQGRMAETPREIRCSICNKLLVESATGYVRATCTRSSCKAVTESHPLELRAEDEPSDMDRLMPMLTALAERPIRIDNPVTIAAGAFRVDSPVTISEGAVSTPVTVTNEAPAVTEPALPDPGEFILRQFNAGLLPLEFAAKKLGYTPEEVAEIVALSAKPAPEPQPITRIYGRDDAGRPMVTRAS